jgi:hypothetical protein
MWFFEFPPISKYLLMCGVKAHKIIGPKEMFTPWCVDCPIPRTPGITVGSSITHCTFTHLREVSKEYAMAQFKA